MHGGKALLDQVKIELGDDLSVWIDVYDNSLSRKWLSALNDLLAGNYLLEKNYCFLGFANSDRDATLLCDLINQSITAINAAGLGYRIVDEFNPENTLLSGPVGDFLPGRTIAQEKFNRLHRYFEDLQGVSQQLSAYYLAADDVTRWHIRQLNLLCHEFESWALSWRKQAHAPEWQRPSQLMCWLHAPRFELDEEDLELFGINTLMRPQGGVFVGVNKAVGKHHWEVFHDEGRHSKISELTTTTLRSQTQAAGDFDIEWGQDTQGHPWMTRNLQDFRAWLVDNGFDPNDPDLTLGHPQCGQVDLWRSFGTMNHFEIWRQLETHLDVSAVSTSSQRREYAYHWNDADYIHTMLGGYK